jgi:tRNA A-37 threonylcarbamoyl transferase component Bud32
VSAVPTIRGYKVLRPLGRGGMGEVFLAEDETLERRVAIKMIAAPHADEGDARSRFLREARAMAVIEHPHVVRVYAFGEADGQPYIVMEYVDGETLAARLSRATRLAIEDALRIAREAALALAAAWSRGIVHKDVKPANILLDREGHVKVADFGLARPPRGDGAEATEAGTVVGTPHYMSPEQARGDEADFRSDIYSLGIVLYEMLGGRKPFTGASPMEVMGKHLRDPLPPIRQSRPDVPPTVANLLEAMTAKCPTARTASYPELLRGLAPLMVTGVLPDPPSMPTLSRFVRPARKPVGFGRWAAALTALVVAAGLVLAFFRAPARHGSFAVAVAPFYGADPESEKEGRVLTALVESELTRRLPEDVDLVGVAEAREIVRSPRAARALARKLDVDMLVWGEALAFQGEVELAARVMRRDGTLVEAAGQSETLSIGLPNAIAARRARAAAVADTVAEIFSRR